MSRRVIYQLLIALGVVLLFASVTYWLDIKTSEKPVGLGQNILGWATVIADILTWIAAYIVNKKDNSKTTDIKVSGGSPLIPTGDGSRAIQVKNGNYIEKIENVEKIEINISPPSEDEIERNKRKYELRNKHDFEAPRVYKAIQDTAIEFQKKLEELDGGYIGVLGPPGSGKSTFLTQTLRTLPVRSVRYYAYVPDAQDPSVLRGESINFFHDTTLQIQRLRDGNEKRPDPTDRIALNEFFYQQLSLLGKDYEETKTKTIILIDGLDHIAREQHPDRSLIEDLPLPATIPSGVYLVLGSQTKGLRDLPVGVQNILSQDEHIIRMGRLSPQNVFEIIHQTLPEISISFDQQIYQLVDGHPLSLIYLLNSLFLSESPDEYTEILDGTIAYRGNIEDQYFSHWKKIEDDLDFSDFLGLLARIRGPIPIKWVAEWPITTRSLLIKLNRIFGQYFSSDSLGRWEFFHNSFRIFLEARTADDLPGRTSEQINQEIHLKLAQLYEKSDDPFRWETLYHYYKAGEHKRVIEIAQYNWFRSQVEALRPIDAIETDVRIAVKSAGKLLDPIALMRYTLVGASLQQRSNALEDINLPQLLIDLDRCDLAIDYARDGARLRLDSEKALSFARKLFTAGLKQEATRIFELAEPLEYLSGRPISGGHDQPQNLHNLLSEWVESASLIRGSIETINIIRRIQKEPATDDKDLLEASIDLQNWLLYKSALSCCEREDWDSWSLFFSSLDEKRDSETRYFTLLRTIEYLRRNNKIGKAESLYKELLDAPEPISFGSGRHETSNLLSLAESARFLKLEPQSNVVEAWLARIPVPPLSDKQLNHRGEVPKLIDLQFRYARLKFIYDDLLTPNELLQNSENTTVFGDYEDEETKLARRQLALIAFSLAKLWSNGYLTSSDDVDMFITKTKWIFDLIELGWTSQTATFRLETEGVKGEISKYIVACAAKFGRKTLNKVQEEFRTRWENSPLTWWAGIQRETILAFVEHLDNFDWARNQLKTIEPIMLQDLDVHGRVEECKKQADAWLSIGEHQFALSTLDRLVKTARGIYHDEDYQLVRWAEWLRKANRFEPSNSIERIKTFINQVVSVEDNASGTEDALHICLQALFDLNPEIAVLAYKQLLEQRLIKHGEGISYLLLAALEREESPIIEVFQIMQCLVLPFERDSPSSLIKQFLAKANSMLGQSEVVELTRLLVHHIEVDVLPKQRKSWIDDVNDGLVTIGINPTTIPFSNAGIQDVVDEYESSIDHSLYLQTGEKLTLDDVCRLVLDVEGFEDYLSQEDRQRTSYFEWYRVANNLIVNSSSKEEISKICELVKDRISDYRQETDLSRVLSNAGSQLFKLGYVDDAVKYIDDALALTRPSGWAINWDGGAKYEVMQQTIAVCGETGREKLVNLYALDLSERFQNPEQILRYGKDISSILFKDIPYLDIWFDIEEYLKELFAGVTIEPQSEIEKILHFDLKTLDNSPTGALARLLMLYLDFPAYPLFNSAIQGCSKLILAGSLAVKETLRQALTKHDQLIINGLISLEVVSLQRPSEISFFQRELSNLQNSPNIIIRIIATKILINSTGQSRFPPKLERSLPAIYMLHLPDIAKHKTEYSLDQDGKSVLLGDPALVLQPLDIEAREIAQNAGVPENNLLYHAVEKLKVIEIQRTWLSNGSALEPANLSAFLEKINLRVSHNKPKIFPCKNSIGHIAAELYDANKLSFSDLPFLDFMFRDYDPTLFLVDAKPRPDYIERAGGLSNDLGVYLDLPKDWDKTLENSLPLLKSHSSDGRLILAEWTHLKRLQREWPSEERVSLLRATASYKIWDGIDLSQERLPFAHTLRSYARDYLELTQHPERELVIAHNGYHYQVGKANWLALNPRVGFDLGWKPVDKGLFSWKNKNDKLVVESIYWQDGNFDSYNPYDHVEVGYGWVVLITEEGYQEIRRHYGVISRGGVIKRSSGMFGINRNTISSVLDTV